MADSAYVIDIATTLDADATTAELDDLTASLIKAGASSETLEAATIQVKQQLREAAAASAAANDALAAGNVRYGELERAALQAAKAVQKAGAKGVIDPDIAKASHDAEEALASFTPALRRLEQGAAGAARAEAKLVTTQSNLAKMSRSSSASFAEQAAAAKKSVKEAEGFVPLAKTFGDFKDAVGTAEGRMILMAGAAIGLAAAVAAVTVAVLAGVVAVAAWAVGLADAKREAGLTTAAAEALDPTLAGLAGDFAKISDATGASATDLRAWKKQLEQAKVPADDLPEALRAMANAEAALGKGGSSEFLDRLKETGAVAGDVAKDVNSKLGGIVEKRMLGLGAQSAKLKKNFSSLFDGLDISGVLDAFKILVDLFDKNTAAGAAMKFLFETVFQPLIDNATKAAYVIEAFALGFLIGMTKLYIQLKPVIKAVKEFFGFDDTGLSDTLDIAKMAGELLAPVFIGIVGIFGLLAVAVGVAIAPFIAISAAMYALIGVIASVATSIVAGLLPAWTAVKDFFSTLDFAQIGSDLIAGLVRGIQAGAGAVIGAITGVANGAINAAKSALGIASPSKVFADIGGYTAEGFSNGIDDGAADAQAAMSAMVEPPAPGALSAFDALSGNAAGSSSAPDAPAAAGSSKGGKPAVHIENLYLGGSKASKADAEALAEAVTLLLEGDAAAIAGEAAA